MSPKKILLFATLTLFFSASIAAAQCCNPVDGLVNFNLGMVNGRGFYPQPFYGGYGGGFYPYSGYGYGSYYGGPQPPMGRQERMAVGAGIGAAIGGGASGNWRGSAIGGGIGALIGLAAGRERNHDRDQYGRPEQNQRPVQQQVCRRGEIPLENQTLRRLEVVNDGQNLGVLGPGQTLCLTHRGNLTGASRRGSETHYAEIWTTTTGLAFRAPNSN